LVVSSLKFKEIPVKVEKLLFSTLSGPKLEIIRLLISPPDNNVAIFLK
jgi:hypothetical protein